MANVFKEGDVVYHVKYGEGVVEKADREGAWLSYNGVTQYGFNYSLSFKPWPKPCHERPIEGGWWVVKLNGSTPFIRYIENGMVFSCPPAVAGRTAHGEVNRFTLIKYLGKEL